MIITAAPAAHDQQPAHLVAHGLAEAVATFVLMGTMTALAATLIGPGLAPGPMQTAAVAVLLAVVIALILVSPLGRISGAHMNPAVTLAFALHGTLSGREAVAYVSGQAIGACLAFLSVAALLPEAFAAIGHGLIRPAPAVSPTMAFALEFAATFALIAMLFRLTSRHADPRWIFAGKAGYFLLVTLILRDSTGAGLNPMRALAPAIVSGEFDAVGLYTSASLLGAAAAALSCHAFGFLARPVHHRFGLPTRHASYTAHLLARLRTGPATAAPARSPGEV